MPKTNRSPFFPQKEKKDKVQFRISKKKTRQKVTIKVKAARFCVPVKLFFVWICWHVTWSLECGNAVTILVETRNDLIFGHFNHGTLHFYGSLFGNAFTILVEIRNDLIFGLFNHWSLHFNGWILWTPVQFLSRLRNDLDFGHFNHWTLHFNGWLFPSFPRLLLLWKWFYRW